LSDDEPKAQPPVESPSEAAAAPERERAVARRPQAPQTEAKATSTPVRSYHVALTAAEVIERLSEQSGVKAYGSRMLPDFGGLIEDAEYTLEIIGKRDFSLHCGPPAARGQSATGMLRLLYLRGRLEPTDAGTRVKLSFAYRRPRWALQRWVGFLALASLGLLWVFISPGEVAKRALLYGGLLLVLVPVVAHDLRRDKRLEQQRRSLLNLMEHSLAAIELDATHPDEPYRKRQLRAEFEEGELDEEDDEDDEDA
jgi:hypothetical protein